MLGASGLATQQGGSSNIEIEEAQPGSVASSVEQPGFVQPVPSRIVGAVGCASGKRCQDAEQSAGSFTLTNALRVWLEAQGDESGSPELRRLRSAVAVLTQKCGSMLPQRARGGEAERQRIDLASRQGWLPKEEVRLSHRLDVSGPSGPLPLRLDSDRCSVTPQSSLLFLRTLRSGRSNSCATITAKRPGRPPNLALKPYPPEFLKSQTPLL